MLTYFRCVSCLGILTVQGNKVSGGSLSLYKISQKRKYSLPLNNERVGEPTLPLLENPWIIYRQPSLYGVPLICDSISTDSADHGECSTTDFTVGKNLSISGPEQFKSMLFKGQLY